MTPTDPTRPLSRHRRLKVATVGLGILTVAVLLLLLPWREDGNLHPHSHLPDRIAQEEPLTSWEVREDTAAFMAVLALEDRRAPTPEDEAALLRYLSHPTPGIRRAAARAVGRLERPELADALGSLLEDADRGVGREAAHALAHLAGEGDPTPEPAGESDLDSADPEVRRLATSRFTEAAPLRRALADPHPQVRLQAIRGWARFQLGQEGCGPILEAVDDPSPSVQLEALAWITQPVCGAGLEDLQQRAGRLGATAAIPGTWHIPMRALRSLVRLAPDRARPLLPEALGHPDPMVRAHAADVAQRLGDRVALADLLRDQAPNVQEAAARSLHALLGGQSHLDLIEQIGTANDAQLLRTLAGLLEGSARRAEATPPMLDALLRVTSRGRSTDRDTRMALLDRIAELGSPTDRTTAGVAATEALAPLLSDPDPRIADRVRALLSGWTGLPVEASPSGLPARPLPSWDALVALEAGVLQLELVEGGLSEPLLVTIRLLPFEAPTNAARLAELARRGELDGLTLHRVASNFVLQGGSPGANEYEGHGDYTRDELGRIGHWRGTVGLSTRGRDTGDGQFFINLVHNLRLNPDYTVFGVVVSDMEALMEVQEGVRMRTARWIPYGTSPTLP
jgi:cyclophilin family peptidyl-prolyl cis-trans isomerase/HEAT repeat protein